MRILSNSKKWIHSGAQEQIKIPTAPTKMLLIQRQVHGRWTHQMIRRLIQLNSNVFPWRS